jgi:predicted small lipoprotein YifL
MKLLRVPTVAAVLIALSGCGKSLPPSGIVTAKQFEPAHTYVVMMPMTTSNGKTTTTTFIPVIISEPDRWVLTIEPYDKDGHPLEPKRALVTQATFDAAKLGGWIDFTPESIDTRKADKKPQ